MPAYSGKFQYLDESGATLNQGPCQFRFDAETCVLTPQAGAPLAFDLGDVDSAAPAEWDLTLKLYTGRTLQLRQFGAAFGRMSEELFAAWRDRTVRCLLLEDLEQVGQNYQATVNGAPAEVRLYGSNLAVLPMAGAPLQWRLAEVDSVVFDDAAYAVTLESAGERLTIGKLAKKTDEFVGYLSDTIDALRTHAAEALHRTFPFLNPDELQRLVTEMPEGRSVTRDALGTIHPKLPEALVARAVDEPLRPYLDALLPRAHAPWMAGFKFIREDEEQEADAQPLFFWFFFPLANNIVAWEATTGSGRATYFFRAEPPVESAVARLTRGLALVNFRREPVYLPEASLEQQPKFHRYAIGCRKLPDLRALRSAFLGRAIHSTVEEWFEQVKNTAG